MYTLLKEFELDELMDRSRNVMEVDGKPLSSGQTTSNYAYSCFTVKTRSVDFR